MPPSPSQLAGRVRDPVIATILVFSLFACAEQQPTVVDTSFESPSLSSSSASINRSILLGSGGKLPADIEAQIIAAGGTVDGVLPEIGVAFASNLNTVAFAGVESVTRNPLLRYYEPSRTVELIGDVTAATSAQVASLADDEPFYPLQHGPAAVQAPEAWNTGITGAGVRVAVIDGGLFSTHPDLAAGVDVAASRSFTTGAFNEDLGTFWHGTHVAGIIGARDNGVGVIGIAPDVTLIGVKVLHGNFGDFGGILSGIIHAAKPQSEGGAGAHVINMSLGAYFTDINDKFWKAELKELAKVFDRAARYANAQGTTLVAAVGNDGLNLDDIKFDLDLPSMSAHVIGVSATGPLGWAYGNTDFARQASYTTFGKSLVNFAAPGGDFAWPTNEPCLIAGQFLPCWVFDMYLSTTRGPAASTGRYSWSAGTSMASPVVAGIAALIIQANGGSLPPSQVRTKLLQGATDLGKRGFDEVYGHGYVSAIGSLR